MSKIKPDSAGSKPALKHVVVFDVQHSEINSLSQLISQKFCEKAKALGIHLKKRGKIRNVPGQPEAVEYLSLVAKIKEDAINYYVEILLKDAKGAQ